MSGAPIVTTTFRVGRRFKVNMSIPRFQPGEILPVIVEWSPRVPSRLTKREAQDYRRGRDLAIAEAARLSGGGGVLTVEV